VTALRPNEWESLLANHAGATRSTNSDGTVLVTIPAVALPPGWSTATSTVWFLVPVGYPGAQPDCFWADPELRLANGAMPANSGPQAVPHLGAPALWISWHLTAWRPSHDSLTTYARFASRRFQDAR
jgi:hypothetical protein